MIKPGFGSGVVSSFFTFFDGSGWQKDWNEIDFEFLGRHTNTLDTNVIHTNGGVTDKNINVRHNTLSLRASDQFWKLCIEWTPSGVIWKINDLTIRSLSVTLNRPQKLMMNIWVGAAPWAGEFALAWQESFESLNVARWYIATHSQGETLFVKEGVSVKVGRLVLTLKS